MSCKLTRSLNGGACEYAVAGVLALYLANYYPPKAGTAVTAGYITYNIDADGQITAIYLPAGEEFFMIDGAENTISFTDALLAGGNGGRYRQHTVNASLGALNLDVLNESDALSLGRFIAIAVDAAGRVVILGRVNGLKAPAGGADYNSGAAEADATGWTLILQGSSTESAKLLASEAVITPIYIEEVTP